MRIRAAIGIGVLIVVLKFLLPNVLYEGERTAVEFLKGARISATTATTLIEHAASSSPSSAGYPRLSLPQTPYPASF